MSDYALAGSGVALLSLIWSEFPFIQLVYVLAVINTVDWTQWGVISGMMLFATLGANISKRLGS